MTDEEIAVRIETVCKLSDHTFQSGQIEIDRHVAAKQKIDRLHPRVGIEIGGEVVPLEDHHLLNILMERIRRPPWRKVKRKITGRYQLHGPLAISPLLRLFQRTVIEI